VIEHNPLYHTPDTAILYLKYFSQGADSYDTVLLTNVIAGNRYEPRIAVTANGSDRPTIKSGDTVTSAFTLLDTVSRTLGLDSIAITMTFDNSAIELAGGPIINSPFSLLREEHTLGTETIVVRVAPTDIAKNIVIATQLFTSYLTIDREAVLAIKEIRFNDSVFNGCVATAAVTPTEIPITVLGCGDSTARAFLRGEELIQILNINSARLRVRASQQLNATLSIYNTLGECVTRSSPELPQGISIVELPPLPSGVYVCVINGAGVLANERFVVVR
jgi:hypothetical protein